MSNEIVVPMKDQRDISTVTTEIRTLHRQAQRMILGYAIEIGRRLTEAKEMLPHGQWGDWLKTEVEFSQSTAQNFMRIFAEYGDSQTSLFGDAKSQTLGNLPYTHALKLLAVPAEEREEFVAEHHVDELSSRALEKLIRERDEAREAAEAWEDGARNAVTALEDMKDKLAGAERDLEEAESARAEAEERTEIAERARGEAEERLADLEDEWRGKVDAATAEAEKLRKAAADAIESAKKAKEKLKKLQENPEVPAEVLEKLKGEAAEEAQKALEAARAEAEAKVKAAEMAAQAAAQRAEEAEKKLRTADAETAAFKARFVDIQNAFATLRRMKDEATDPDKAAGMQRAVQALLERERGLWA